MTTLPFHAIFIGGPPHSGKSTLTYRLSKAFRAERIAHYVLRAQPDGEGDWSQEADEAVVRELRPRAKKPWTPEFVEWLCGLIASRHLPLLVDAGGMPSSEAEMIASCCTRAMILSNDDAARATWHGMFTRLGIPIIIDLFSSLTSTQSAEMRDGVLTGTISGLAKERSSDGVAFDALLRVVRPLLAIDAEQLYALHCMTAGCSPVLHLEHWHAEHAQQNKQKWQPGDLATLLAALAQIQPQGLYGRAPVWVYGAAAAAIASSPRLFDVRYGWIAIPDSVMSDHPHIPDVEWNMTTTPSYARIACQLQMTHLDFSEFAAISPICVPRPTGQEGIVLDGKLPNWFFALLVRAYRDRPWVAIYYPQGNQAVVVASRDPHVPVGSTIGVM